MFFWNTESTEVAQRSQREMNASRAITALLVGCLLIFVGGMSLGCSAGARLKYNLVVENHTAGELADVRVSLDRTDVGARFGVLVSKGQKVYILYNTPVRAGYLLCFEKRGAAGEWSSWLAFKTDDLPLGWDGEIRLVIEDDGVRLQLTAKDGAKSVVAQGTLASGCVIERTK